MQFILRVVMVTSAMVIFALMAGASWCFGTLFQGGYFDKTKLFTGIFALVLITTLVLVRRLKNRV